MVEELMAIEIWMYMEFWEEIRGWVREGMRRKNVLVQWRKMKITSCGLLRGQNVGPLKVLFFSSSISFSYLYFYLLRCFYTIRTCFTRWEKRCCLGNYIGYGIINNTITPIIIFHNRHYCHFGNGFALDPLFLILSNPVGAD